jgi:3-hydroxyisobutyrate dehydrogenase
MTGSAARIAFVGLGAMGSEMARVLVGKQHHVTGYDMRRSAVDALAAVGGHGAGSAAEAARGARTLILMVVNADQAEQVLFADGALAATAPDAAVMLMATCAPDRVAVIARKVEAAGRGFLDAPVSGGTSGAKGGTLTIMAAGRPELVARERPILEAMSGPNLFVLGDTPGQGAAMKIVNQLLCGAHIAVAAEGLALAEKAGIDPAKALEILSGSAASSWMLKARGPRMVHDDDVVTSAVDIFVKDLDLVLSAGKGAKIGLPLAAAAHQQFIAASGLGHGGRDDSQVIRVYRALMGK